jgi:hypothetical protein
LFEWRVYYFLHSGARLVAIVNRQHWQEWESELLERERTWEQKKAAWRFIPNVEEAEPKSIGWNIVGTALCLLSFLKVMAAIWAVFR